MHLSAQSSVKDPSRGEPLLNGSDLFSCEPVLRIVKLIPAGSPLPEV
jgi:hypothetical protein